MRKQLFKRIAVIGLSAVIATASFTGCGKKNNDTKTSEVKGEKTQASAFAEAIKASLDIESGEWNGTFDGDFNDNNISYTWKMLNDGNNNIMLQLKGKTEKSPDADVVLYDNVLYITADLSMIMGSGSTGVTSISLDVNKLMEQSGVDVSNAINDEAKKDSKIMLKETIDIIAKAMPSVFGDELVINEGNAEKAADEFIAFRKNDLRTIYNLFNEFRQKKLPNAKTEYFGADMSDFEKSIEEYEKKEVTEEERQELIDGFKKANVKVSADVTGEEGARVYSFTSEISATDDEPVNDTAIDVIRVTLKFDGKFEEKESVDIKSYVPENAMSVDDYIDAMLSTTNNDAFN